MLNSEIENAHLAEKMTTMHCGIRETAITRCGFRETATMRNVVVIFKQP